MLSLDEVKQMLTNGRYSCVISTHDGLLASRERGVRPLVNIIDAGADCKGGRAADKVLGKASAFLYAELGVAEIYATVASEGAVAVCEKYGIMLTAGAVVKNIINRAGDGICPMEALTADIGDSHAAYNAIIEKLKSK